MSETPRRRKRSDQRNLLYEESSLWGVYVFLFVVALVVCALLVYYLTE